MVTPTVLLSIPHGGAAGTRSGGVSFGFVDAAEDVVLNQRVRVFNRSKEPATFKVRPTKSGRATIRMAECGDVARFAVKPARRVQTRQVPRVTG